MTENEIIKVLLNELECVKRQYGNLCDNKRDCNHCDLALKEEIVISAYENAIELINCQKAEKRKVKNYIKTHCNPYGKPDFDYDTSIKILNFIDDLVKERRN